MILLAICFSVSAIVPTWSWLAPVGGPPFHGRYAVRSVSVKVGTWGVTLLPAWAMETTSETDARLYGGLTLQQWHERLGHLDPADPHSASVVPALIEIIQDRDLPADARRPFAMTLGRIGLAAQEAVPVFVAQIQQRDQLGKPTYAWAARALGLYGVHARQAAPALIDLLFDETVPQAYRTLPVEALARIGTSHPDVLPALIRLLQYEGSDTSDITAADASVFRELAAEALGIMGPDADLAAPLLVRAVRNVGESQAVRRKAIAALGSMGPRVALAIPALIETLEFDRSAVLRGAAAEALGKIGLPALPVLYQYLRHSDPQVRANVVRAIGQMGEQARPAVPTVIAALADPDDEVRMSICESLDAIGTDPGQFIEPLVQLLTSDLRQVRMRSMRLLIKLGSAVRPYREQLRKLQQDPRSTVRAIASKTLKKIEH